MKCNICGSEVESGMDYCKYCGNKIDWPKLNEDITDKIDERAVPSFCSKCGRKLDVSTHKCLFCDLHNSDGDIYKDNMNTYNNKTVNRYISSDELKHENRYYREVNSQMASKSKKKNTKKKPEKKNPALVITLSVAGMMALFAVTFLIFFNLLGGSTTSENEETQIPVVSQTPTTTPVLTSSPMPETTKKPESTQRPVYTKQPTQKPAEKPTAKPTEKTDVPITDGKYAYPSESRVITKEELDDMSRQQIKIVLNEIYARHGYTFNDDDLVEYFESKTWYVPTISDMSEAERKFNDFEMENKNIIVEYQKEQGWRE